MNFFANMPKDPFEDDPNDPASFIEDDEQLPPLTQEEKVAILHDLALVQEFTKALRPRGIDGIFFLCDDCEEHHFYEWDIIAANMKATLDGDMAPVHEPSAQPDPTRYVPWDYALGFMDGLEAR